MTDRCPIDFGAVACPRIAADATYLVTGGLGALGLKVAEWLVEQVGRVQPSRQVRGGSRDLSQVGSRDQSGLPGPC